MLPTVTLCAATSVNVAATVSALRYSLEISEFAQCLLFTDVSLEDVDARIRVVPIPPLTSSADYSEFILSRLADFITTDHCLIAQWDGFVLHPEQWDDAFLNCDYIGAPWPQFSDDHQVGNGGFSLRSRRLLEACRDDSLCRGHPEDVAICRNNRALLEQKYNMKFADRALAERFSFERGPSSVPTFGFHGVFNMIPLLGVERFWETYRGLDDKSAALTDYVTLMRQLGSGASEVRRRLRLTTDRAAALLGRRGRSAHAARRTSGSPKD